MAFAYNKHRLRPFFLMAGFSILLLGLGACAQNQYQAIAREDLAANLAPLLKIEKRAEQVKYYTVVLNNVGGLPERDAQALKDHYDIYYVYYLAASSHLGRGHLDSYRAHVRLAEIELDSMESILKETLGALGQREFGQSNKFSRFGF